MIGDLLLRKETPLVLPPEGSPAIGLRCKSKYWLNMLFGLSLSSTVIPIWNVDVLPRLPMPYLLLLLVQSRVTVYRGVARDCARIAFLAELRNSCSLPLCADYAPCGAAELMLLAAVCRLDSLRSDWHLVTLGLSKCWA
ncbi:hypothetical protein Tco_0728777 [Tanacetum coccineum]|uniref:Uncharacterized protein n=1 Tax=Tanacetum coccineum TaxID=301880 RepID=A0ABQ4YN86_9ASTR